jgi:hypothetical protein
VGHSRAGVETRKYASKREMKLAGVSQSNRIITSVEYLTGSLRRRQSQQSSNTLTPFYFPFFTHYMFRPLLAIFR